MAYLNPNNVCIFEGRLTADPELRYINTNNNSLAKCSIKIAVDRNMTKEVKSRAKETADFVPVEILGPKADFVQKYFSKGSPIKVVASFKTFSYQKDGQTVYGYGFDAVDVSFTVGGNSSNTCNVNSKGNNIDSEFSSLDPQGFQAIDDDDIPF